MQTIQSKRFLYISTHEDEALPSNCLHILTFYVCTHTPFTTSYPQQHMTMSMHCRCVLCAIRTDLIPHFAHSIFKTIPFPTSHTPSTIIQDIRFGSRCILKNHKYYILVQELTSIMDECFSHSGSSDVAMNCQGISKNSNDFQLASKHNLNPF